MNSAIRILLVLILTMGFLNLHTQHEVQSHPVVAGATHHGLAGGFLQHGIGETEDGDDFTKDSPLPAAEPVFILIQNSGPRPALQTAADPSPCWQPPDSRA